MTSRREEGKKPSPATEGPFAFLSRRRWLKLGLSAGTALLGTGLGTYLVLRGSAPSVPGLRHLDDHEYQTLANLTAMLFPACCGFELSAEAMDLPRQFDRFLSGEPEDNITDLRRALTLLELGPAIYDKKFTTFSQMLRHEQEAFFVGWMTSDDLTRRMVTVAFRKFLNLVFYDHEETWPFIGYPGPSMQATT